MTDTHLDVSSALLPAGTARSRVWSVMASGFAVVLVFALTVFGLRLNDPKLFVIFAIGVAALGGAWVLLVRRFPSLHAAMAREQKLLAVGSLLCAGAYPLLADDPYQIHVMAMAGIFALMAIGLNVTIGFAGLADFGYISFYALGAYASAVLNVKLGLNFWACLPLAGMFAAALSLLVALPALRVTGHYLALVTLGFAFIVIQMVTNLESITGGTQGIAGIEPPGLLSHSFQSPLKVGAITLPYQANFYYLVLTLLTLGAIVCIRLAHSRWGRAWAAMRNDEVAAEASGLNLVKLKLMAFSTGGSFGGLAGSLYAHMVGYIDPSSFRFIESVFLLAIVVLGNFRVAGVIVAAVLFTILPEKLRAFDEWRLLIFGLVLLVVMLARGRRMVGGSY